MSGVDVTSVISILGVGNTLYVGTQQALIKVKDGIFEVIDIDNGNNVHVNSLCYYNKELYVGTKTGLFRYNDETKDIKKLNDLTIDAIDNGSNDIYYISDENCYSLSHGLFYDSVSIKSLLIEDDIIYLGTSNGKLVTFGNRTSKTIDVSSSLKPINKMIKHNNEIYLASDEGLFIYDGNESKIISGLYTENRLSDLMFDYQGNLWVTSTDKSISKIVNNSFTNIFFKYNLEDRIVTSVKKYKDKLYIASETGLIIIDEVNGKVIENNLTNMLKDIRIRDFDVFNDKLYIATYDTDLYDVLIYDGTNTSEITKDKLVEPGETDYKKSGQIRVLTSNDDYLFIGTNYGIARVDHNGNIIAKQTPQRALYLYPNGDYLYACFDNNGGVGIYDLDLNFIKTIEGSNDLTILKCYMTSRGLVYNYNSKLYLYNNSESKALVTNITGSIFEIFEYNNILYLGSDTGLYLVNMSDLDLDVIPYALLDKTSGLSAAIQSNASGYFDLENKNFYFCTTETVFCYDLDNDDKENIPLKIGIDELVVDGVTIPLDNIKISKNATRITINVSYYNFVLKDDYYVYYMLEGFENHYHSDYMANALSITYTNLKGGTYHFKLYAVDEDGVHSLNDINIEIVKEKKFFEQIWVIIFIIILGVAFVFYLTTLIFKYRTKKIIQKQLEYKAITLESIEAIARTIDAKDSYTNGHSTRVGKYSKLIAISLGLSEEEVENIYYIALLHDIGKIAIPDNILNKPSRLTDEEFSIMKSHTTRGAIILSSISTIPHIIEGAKSHHERYDGTGYPEGLKGEDIPFIARIICCADCYDAMATKRVYKEPYEKERIIEEFNRCSGTQFDPNIARVVVQMIKDGILDDGLEKK